MKLKNIIITIALIIFSVNSALATQLPKPVKDFILDKYPNSTIRFDGLITLPDGNIYLPVIPSYLEKVDKLDVAYLYPENTNFKKLPEVIIFNNNYSLLKLIRTKNGILTVCNNPDIPLTVKTGALPQDILVPRGLVLPETLKGILGNVQVPLLNASAVIKEKGPKEQKLIVETAETPKTSSSAKFVTATNLNQKLKGKNYYVSNLDTQYLKVFQSESPNPAYSLKISGVPKDMKPVCGGKYLLVISNSQKQMDVIDVQNEYIAKQIDLSVYPNEISIDETNQKAYVSSLIDRSIFVIDLKEMKIKEKINLIGSPEKIAISEDGTKLAYIDRSTSDLYILKLDGSYENKLITNAPNTAEIILFGDRLYKINRVDNTLSSISYDLEKVFEEEEEIKPSNESLSVSGVMDGIASGFKNPKKKKKSLIQEAKHYSTDEKTFVVNEKPTDMTIFKGNLFILCSQNSTINVFDTKNQKLTKEIKLTASGFPRRITEVPNSNLALITNVIEKKYQILDFEKEAILQTVNINSPINVITIVDKK